MIMVIKSRHIYRLLILSLAGILLLSLFWEFYLEDLVVSYIYVYYHPEPIYERLEYVFVSLIAAAIALIVPGWIAIHSTRQTEKAMEALGKARDELDQRVQQRTAELENSNRELVSALERQRDTEEALRSSVADLKLLSSRLLVLQEDEKKFLASELHESLSQTLSALKFRFEHILSHGQVGDAEMTTDIQHKVLPTIQGAIDDVRNIYMDLRPTLLDDLGLTATLNWLSVEFRKKNPQIHVVSDIAVDENDIPEHLKIVIFRVVQEALKNIARHSRAQVARFSLSRENDTLDLVLKDDGIGFDMADTHPGSAPLKGTGLSSMRARVEQTRGSFQIEADNGTGVLIRASWPALNEQVA